MTNEKKKRILWTDDEIDILRSHILFLNEKGYDVDIATNGNDAVDLIHNNQYDLILLDENMPGISGIDTLNRIREINSEIPVVMITKSEEENIMETAIGSKIADYLIKPVNPNQILLTVKKNLETRKLITRETTSAYQAEFRNLGEMINQASDYSHWKEIYKKIVYWELELEHSEDPGMFEVFRMQKLDAEQGFSRYIRENYLSWFSGISNNKPLLSPEVLKEKVFPLADNNQKVVVLLIDNLRLDHWKMIYTVVNHYYAVVDDSLFCSILPTATQYARNAMFAGLMPLEISSIYKDLWLNDDEEGAKNQFEEQLLKNHITRLGKQYKIYYEKIVHSRSGKKLVDSIANLLNYDIVFIVYNFIDTLSHANTELEMIRELAGSDSAYRSLVMSWFRHSQLLDLIKVLSEKNITLIFTTDHGSIRVDSPVKVIGDKKTSANLRYKTGKSLNYNPHEVFEIKDPHAAHLPKSDVSSSYIFAMYDDFFAYPNNFNYYAGYYRNTFQHGGISMEEMIVPVVTLKPR